MIAAGVGFRMSATSADIVDIVRRARDQVRQPVQLLAAPELKAGEAALLEAVSILELPLLAVAHQQLESVQAWCPTQSAAAKAAIGLASVAEACALAALDEGARLMLPRITNARASCALAMGHRS